MDRVKGPFRPFTDPERPQGLLGTSHAKLPLLTTHFDHPQKPQKSHHTQAAGLVSEINEKGQGVRSQSRAAVTGLGWLPLFFVYLSKYLAQRVLLIRNVNLSNSRNTFVYLR